MIFHEVQGHSNWYQNVHSRGAYHHTNFDRNQFISVWAHAKVQSIIFTKPARFCEKKTCFYPLNISQAEQNWNDFNTLACCNSTLHFFQIDYQLYKKKSTDFSAFSHPRGSERNSFNLLSNCRVQYSLSLYQVWKKSVHKHQHANQHNIFSLSIFRLLSHLNQIIFLHC